MWQILLHTTNRTGSFMLPLFIFTSLFCTPGFGQNENGGELRLRLTCRKVTQMGSSKLMNAYTRKFGDEPTAMEAAMEHYNECKEADNTARTNRLAASERNRIENLHSMLANFISVRYHLDGMGVGGDAKAFAMDELSAYSDLSDMISRVISDFEKPATAQTDDRAPIDERFARVKEKLAVEYGKSPGDYIEELREHDPENYEQQKNSYFEHYGEMLTRLADIRRAAKTLSPTSASHLIGFVENFYQMP